MSEDAYDPKVLLELRERARDDAQDELARQVALLAQKEREVKERQADLARAVEHRKQRTRECDERAARGQSSIGELNAFTDYLKGLRLEEREHEQKIERAKEAVQAQKRVIATAQKALVEAAKELEAVIAHHNQWLEEQRILADRKQGVAMDDIAARIWRENNS